MLVAGNVKRRIKATAGWASSLFGAYSRDFASKMVIVAFHRVNDDLPADGLTCGSKKFEAFCRFFRDYFTVVSFSEQVAGLSAGYDMGGTLSITFDDGYLDNFQIAAPILKKLNLPATFFVATGFMGSGVVPFWDEDLPHQVGWMSWDQLRELKDQGFDFGCHTDTHINMGVADEDTVRRELELSRGKLEDELDISANLFAYPFGGKEHISDRSRSIIRELGFVSCASCHGGVNSSTADPFHLRRVGIGEWFKTPHQFGFELLTGRA